MSIFSSHYNSSGTVEDGVGALAEELAIDSAKKVSVKKAHSRQRRSHARVGMGTVAGVGEEVRMLTLKSSDVLYSLLLSSDGGSTAGDADLGIYLSGANHDGALPAAACVDAFSTTAVDIDTAHDRVEHFENGDYDTENIGLQLWELVNITAASTYTVDPKVSFDLVFTMTVEPTVAISLVQLEAFYVAGD